MRAAESHCTDCIRIYIIVTELRLQTGPLTPALAGPRPAAAIWPHLATPPTLFVFLADGEGEGNKIWRYEYWLRAIALPPAAALQITQSASPSHYLHPLH